MKIDIADSEDTIIKSDQAAQHRHAKVELHNQETLLRSYGSQLRSVISINISLLLYNCQV